MDNVVLLGTVFPTIILFLIGLILISPDTDASNLQGGGSISASVRIASACTLGSTSTGPHTASIEPGTYKESIGSTSLRATCNDPGGYAIYAIGYTDSVLGKTTLTANINGQLEPTKDIVTGIATSGNISNWAMRLEDNSPSAHPTTIIGGFDTYSMIPNTQTKVAARDVFDAVAPDSELTVTYAAYVSPGQTAGVYDGKVKFTLVFPATSTAIYGPQASEPGYITYHANATNVEGTMATQAASDGESIILRPSNFSRDGYGFAGWSDVYDYEANTNAHFYGPMETITVPEGTTAHGLSLYAIWIKSQGNLQDSTKVASLCGTGPDSLTQAPTDGTANLSSVSALTDQRDNQTYAIAKLADGKCWMIENLRLEAEDSRGNNRFNPSITNESLAQGYDASFIGLADAESSDFSNSTTANSLYSIDGSTDKTISGDYKGYRFPRYDNSNTQQRVNIATDSDANIYSYGNYYTWAAAIADTTHYDTNNQSITNTSFCPSGWTIPRGGNRDNESNSDFWDLVVNGINNGTKPANFDSSNNPLYRGTPEGDNASIALRAYPNNFLSSGYLDNSSTNSRGSVGGYWSSTPYAIIYSYYLRFHESYVNPGTRVDNKSFGLSIRCIQNSGV